MQDLLHISGCSSTRLESDETARGKLQEFSLSLTYIPSQFPAFQSQQWQIVLKQGACSACWRLLKVLILKAEWVLSGRGRSMHAHLEGHSKEVLPLELQQLLCEALHGQLVLVAQVSGRPADEHFS